MVNAYLVDRVKNGGGIGGTRASEYESLCGMSRSMGGAGD